MNFSVGLIPGVCVITVIAGLLGLPPLPFFFFGTLAACFMVFRMTRAAVAVRSAIACAVIVGGRFIVVSLFPEALAGHGWLSAAVVSLWPSWIVCALALLLVGLLGIFGGAAVTTGAAAGKGE